MRRQQGGFSLVETILGVWVSSLIVFGMGMMMRHQASTFSFIANRTASMSDARFVLNKIRTEFEGLDTSDVVEITNTSISYYDRDGNLASFGLEPSTLELRRGSDVVLEEVGSFSLTFYDGNGDELSAIPESIQLIRSIQISLGAKAKNNNGQIVVSETIVPRRGLGYDIL
ncbi:MAG: hypothetical protein H7A33_03485 [Deltaproteobacteria bacterium]|nr:hypothetical protein [Deltaproteobacteria bacterium]